MFAYLEGFAFCTIRPAVALSLIPFGYNGSLGVVLRVPLILIFAALPQHAGLPSHLLTAGLLEALAGMVLGLLLGVVFHVASTAGALLDQQSGYTIAAVYDPHFQEEAALCETLFTQFAAVTVFTGAGMRAVSGFFADAWALWPPGMPPADFGRILQMFAQERVARSLLEGVRLAMPLIGLMLLVDVSLGLMSRHAKRLNPFTTARAVKVMILSLAVMSIVPLVFARFQEIFTQSLVLR